MNTPGSSADRLVDALRRLPEFRGIAFRGAERAPSSELVVAVPLPTSTDPRIATENFSTPIVVAVLVESGRLIGARSRTPRENEVVLLPGTVLRVAARSAAGDLVVLEEERSAPDARIDQALADITVLLETSRAAAPVEIASPGKFTG